MVETFVWEWSRWRGSSTLWKRCGLLHSGSTEGGQQMAVYLLSYAVQSGTRSSTRKWGVVKVWQTTKMRLSHRESGQLWCHDILDGTKSLCHISVKTFIQKNYYYFFKSTKLTTDNRYMSPLLMYLSFPDVGVQNVALASVGLQPPTLGFSNLWIYSPFINTLSG